MVENGEQQKAIKFDTGKPKLSLISHGIFNEIILCLTREKDELGNDEAFAARTIVKIHSATHAQDLEGCLLIIQGVINDYVNTYGLAKTMEMVAGAKEFGLRKYGRNNWKKGMEWSRLLDSSMRHLLAILCGETIDSDSGYTHLLMSLGGLDMFLGSVDIEVGVNDLFE